MRSQSRRGPDLPYELLAGVEPCPAGWLVAAAKFVGANLAPEAPYVVATFREILDTVPSFSVLAVHIPIGLPDRPLVGGRSCDREARKVLGWPRLAAIHSTPAKQVLAEELDGHAAAAERNGGRLDIVTYNLLPKIAEVAAEIQPYHQRFVFEVEPELGFLQLNENMAMRYAKRSRLGQEERMSLLRTRVPGANRILDVELPRVRRQHLVDACMDLWTARRIAGRAIVRLPENPEWNDEGLRMELIR